MSQTWRIHCGWGWRPIPSQVQKPSGADFGGEGGKEGMINLVT